MFLQIDMSKCMVAFIDWYHDSMDGTERRKVKVTNAIINQALIMFYHFCHQTFFCSLTGKHMSLKMLKEIGHNNMAKIAQCCVSFVKIDILVSCNMTVLCNDHL